MHLVISTLNSLDIEDGVGGVHRGLVLCGLADQSLLGGEGDEGWGGEASLLVGDWIFLSACGTSIHFARGQTH